MHCKTLDYTHRDVYSYFLCMMGLVWFSFLFLTAKMRLRKNPRNVHVLLSEKESEIKGFVLGAHGGVMWPAAASGGWSVALPQEPGSHWPRGTGGREM